MKHECPDCGKSHEMDAEERISRLEKRVQELEAQRCNHSWWSYPYYYRPISPMNVPTITWSNGTTSTNPMLGSTTVWYDNHSDNTNSIGG